jgi:hypothetical protein
MFSGRLRTEKSYLVIGHRIVIITIPGSFGLHPVFGVYNGSGTWNVSSDRKICLGKEIPMKYVLCLVVVLFANVAVAQYPTQGYPPLPLAPVVPQLSQPPVAPIIPPTAEGFRDGWRETWTHEWRPLTRREDRYDDRGEWQMNPYGQYQRNIPAYPPVYPPMYQNPVYQQPAPVYYQQAPMCPPQQRYYQPRTSWW